MEQECHCQNHIQCDIFPSPLTAEIVLQSYQHFIQYLHQKGYTTEGGSIPTDQARQNQKQMKNPTKNDVPFSAPRQKNKDEEENEKPTKDMLDEGEQSADSNKPSKFYPIVTVDYAKGKTYCYKYFRTYKYDWRSLLTNDNGEPIECTWPRARIHDKKCVWYNPNYINIPDTRNDLSTSVICYCFLYTCAWSILLRNYNYMQW